MQQKINNKAITKPLVDFSKQPSLVTKIGGNQVPQRKPHVAMNIPELVKKIEKKAGIKTNTQTSKQLLKTTLTKLTKGKK